MTTPATGAFFLAPTLTGIDIAWGDFAPDAEEPGPIHERMTRDWFERKYAAILPEDVYAEIMKYLDQPFTTVGCVFTPGEPILIVAVHGWSDDTPSDILPPHPALFCWLQAQRGARP